MIYYFVQHDGTIQTAENVKGYWSKDVNPNLFTNRRKAIACAKKTVKMGIKELQERLECLRKGEI